MSENKKNVNKSEECDDRNEKKYAVIESTVHYMICHGSGLSLSDAHFYC